MTSEDLTRILVNLVKNSGEAMSAVGRIHISLWESRGEGNTPWITLNVEDNGPGLADKVMEKIFEPRRPSQDAFAGGEWPLAHRGLGLSITRSIVEAAGGMIHAANRDPVGACFQIELPVQVA
jgi:signal transduction histidine kinase